MLPIMTVIKLIDTVDALDDRNELDEVGDR